MAFPGKIPGSQQNANSWKHQGLQQPYNLQLNEHALLGRIINPANNPPPIGGPYDSTRALEENIPPRLQGVEEMYNFVVKNWWSTPSPSDAPGSIERAYAMLRPAGTAPQLGLGAFSVANPEGVPPLYPPLYPPLGRLDGGAYVPPVHAQEETVFRRTNIVQTYSPNLDMVSVLKSQSHQSFLNLFKTFRESVDDDALKNFDVDSLGETPTVKLTIVYWLNKLKQCEEFKNVHTRPNFCHRVLSILLFATQSLKYLEILKTVALETDGDAALGLDWLELARKSMQ